MSKGHVEFRIKLLSGNNVVLVEANGYESEIFVPQINNGRISFHNIIPNRRCCYGVKEGYSKNPKRSLLSKPSSPNQKSSTAIERVLTHNTSTNTPSQSGASKPILSVGNKVLRMSAGETIVPRATSTPAIKMRMHTIGKENVNNPVSTSSILLTPDVVRRSVPSPYEVIKDTISKIPSGIKVVRLYSNPTPGTPRNIGRIISRKDGSKSLTQSAGNTISYSNISSFRTPLTPRNLHRNSTLTAPTLSSLQKQVIPIIPTKLRKYKNLRTYSRTTQSSEKQKEPQSVRHKPFLSTYLHNPTQGIKGTHKMRHRKRKLIIDPIAKIPSVIYKKRMKVPLDATNTYQFRLPKSRRAYMHSKYSAFDLLTTSNYDRTMAKSLKDQFRRNCVNTASATNPKYKSLTKVPPLELDEQTRHLLAKAKAKSKYHRTI